VTPAGPPSGGEEVVLIRPPFTLATAAVFAELRAEEWSAAPVPPSTSAMRCIRRRAGAARREILPDPKHGSRLVAKFVNMMMYGGKKSTAERIMYDALQAMEDRARQDSLKLFKSAVDNCKPAVEVKSRRVGGSTYQVPVEVRPDRRTALSMRWLIGAARRRSERSMADKLAGELLDAANNRGTAVKKREDTHKMAEANKAFAHYRW